MNLYENVGTYVPDCLFAGNEVPVIPKGFKIKVGQGILKRGSVIAVDDATGEGILVTKATVKSIIGVLTDDVVTDKSVISTVYQSGCFNASELKFGADITLKEADAELRKFGIFTKSVKGV